MKQIKHHRSGFALLMTLLVVSAVVSIAVTIVELSQKQLALSITARDSEIAFYGASAGVECLRYVKRYSSTTLEVGADEVAINCFNKTNNSIERQDTGIDITGPGSAYRYQGAISWGTNDRCSIVDMLVMVNDPDETTDMVIADTELRSLYLGYATTSAKYCPPGGVCTIAEVSGYNATCPTPNASGDYVFASSTIRREVLVEF